jgi:septal ring factor EnvC (AmiA/AmiB activator)
MKNKKELTINDLALMVGKGFAGMDKKFEKIDQKFEKIDQRFEKIDQRFEKIDERFDKLEEKINQIDAKIDSIDRQMQAIFMREDRFDLRVLRTKIGCYLITVLILQVQLILLTILINPS